MRRAWICGALLLGCATLGCAAKHEPSPLEPKIGHSQPLPPESGPTRTVAPEDRDQLGPGPDEPDQPVLPEPEQDAAESVPTVAPPELASGEDEELCRHITRVVLAESGNAAGLTTEQIDELIASCSLALAQDRRELDPAEFRRRAECVRAADTVADFSACQPSGR